MTTKTEILDSAMEVLRSGGALTIDAVARAVGITKPGVVHHFPTKEALSMAVVDHLLDGWEVELRELWGPGADTVDRVRTYVEFAVLGDMDPADLAMLADPRLRSKLVVRWRERLDAWFGTSEDPAFIAARLIADGAWIDRSLGLVELEAAQGAAVVAVVLELMDKGARP